MQAPLKWHGGKYYLKKRIWELAPEEYSTRVIPFAGGLQEFWDWTCPNCNMRPHEHRAGCPGLNEIVNDLNEDLVNFYRVLRSEQRSDLLEELRLTPFNEADFKYALTGHHPRNTRAGRAWAFFVRYRQSRQGLGIDFATPTTGRTRRKGNEQTSSWESSVEGLPDAMARLKRVLVYNRQGLQVLKATNNKKTFAYLDPPYHPDTRVAGEYEMEMSAQDHKGLLTFLRDRFKGRFLLSGYRCQLYDDIATEAGWNRTDVPQKAHSSSATDKPDRVESLWRNYGE